MHLGQHRNQRLAARYRALSSLESETQNLADMVAGPCVRTLPLHTNRCTRDARLWPSPPCSDGDGPRRSAKTQHTCNVIRRWSHNDLAPNHLPEKQPPFLGATRDRQSVF